MDAKAQLLDCKLSERFPFISNETLAFGLHDAPKHMLKFIVIYAATGIGDEVINPATTA